jgi:hypothetical protein
MEIHHDHEIAIPPRDDAHGDSLSMSDVHPPSIATTFNNRQIFHLYDRRGVTAFNRVCSTETWPRSLASRDDDILVMQTSHKIGSEEEYSSSTTFCSDLVSAKHSFSFLMCASSSTSKEAPYVVVVTLKP